MNPIIYPTDNSEMVTSILNHISNALFLNIHVGISLGGVSTKEEREELSKIDMEDDEHSDIYDFVYSYYFNKYLTGGDRARKFIISNDDDSLYVVIDNEKEDPPIFYIHSKEDIEESMKLTNVDAKYIPSEKFINI